MNKTFYPTHTCFDDAIEFIELLITHKKDISDLYVVHALLKVPKMAEFIGTKDSGIYAHAWIEDEQQDACIQAYIYNGEKDYYLIEKEDFYNEHKIVDMTRYTLDEVSALNKKHMNYGPWEDKYIVECAKRGK